MSRRSLISLTVMLGVIMAVIDTSIVNVAITDMAGTLGASIDEVGWVVTGYILASVIVMPLNGWLTARFGRRNFYAGCLVIFTVASFLCGTATSIWQLVAYRVLQGIGGGALQPTAQAIIFETYPIEKRAQAMAIFGMGVMVGPAIGPTIGGILVDNYSWPLIFYINLPIGIAALLMTLAFIRDRELPQARLVAGGLAGARAAHRRAGVAAVRPRARPARRLVRLADDHDDVLDRRDQPHLVHRAPAARPAAAGRLARLSFPVVHRRQHHRRRRRLRPLGDQI